MDYKNKKQWFSYIVQTIAQLAECVDLESLCIRDRIKNYHTVMVMMLHPALIANSSFCFFVFLSIILTYFGIVKKAKDWAGDWQGMLVDRQFPILHNALE